MSRIRKKNITSGLQFWISFHWSSNRLCLCQSSPLNLSLHQVLWERKYPFREKPLQFPKKSEMTQIFVLKCWCRKCLRFQLLVESLLVIVSCHWHTKHSQIWIAERRESNHERFDQIPCLGHKHWNGQTEHVVLAYAIESLFEFTYSMEIRQLSFWQLRQRFLCGQLHFLDYIPWLISLAL